MSRKQELCKRAGIVAESRMRLDTDFVSDYMFCFEEGYRQAMRDARRAYNSHRTYSLRCIALVEWLRPLR